MANTRIPIFNADAQTAYIDYEQDATDGDGRQVIVVGDPSAKAAVAGVSALDVGSSSTAYGQIVRLAGSAQVNIVAVGSGVTLGVNLGKVDGTIQVNVGKIDDNVSVKFASVAGTAGVNIGKIDGTIQTIVGKIDDVVSVRMNSVAGTVGVNLGKVDGTVQVNVGKIDDYVVIKAGGSSGSFAVHLLSTNGTIAVNLGKVDGTVAVYLHSTGGTLGVNVGKIEGTSAVFLQGTGGTLGVRVGQIDGSVAVHLVGTGGTLGVRVGQIDGSIAVHLVGTGGSLAVKLDPSYNVVNAAHTIIIPSTVSGTVSTAGGSGANTLISPEASHNTKVYAYSIQTTGAVSIVPRFTDGRSGAGLTEFWRPLVTANAVTGVQGANLAVTPPGYLFATGTNVTLAIYLDSATLVHYSIAYFKESA